MNLRKDQWLAVAIVAVVVGTFGLVVFLPQSRQLGDLRQQYVKAQDTLQQDKAKLLELAKIRGEIARADAEIAACNRRLPDGDELGPFLKDISNYSQLCGLDGATFLPQKPRDGEMFSETSIQMRFKGTFEELFRFLRQARCMPRLTRVQALTIHNDQALSGECSIDLVMDIYYTGVRG